MYSLRVIASLVLIMKRKLRGKRMLGKHKRIVNKKVIQAIRKQKCELCGAPAYAQPHHINTVGSGGGDIPENLIQLCSDCHMGAHDGRISKKELMKIVAEREGISPTEVYRINRRAMGYDV